MREGEPHYEEPRVNNQLDTLKEKGIVSFDTQLTPEEKIAREDIRVEKALAAFDYYGPADQILEEQLSAHLRQLDRNSEETIQALSGLMTRLSKNVLTDLSKESAWVTVRISLPSHKFNIPRWHQDGAYFQNEEETYKFVFAVKGAPTRFAEITDPESYRQCREQASTNFIENYTDNRERYDEEELRIRKSLASAVTETEPVTEDQATLYLVGAEDAKVHSEPPMDTPRIFMSVVPGSSEQIEEIRKRQTT